MNRRIFSLALATFISSSCLAFTDSLWIVGAEGYPGDLVTVEAWLQYEGGGPGDSISAFDIPLTWDASVCTVEALSLGSEFAARGYTFLTLVDNQGIEGLPPTPKVSMSAFTFDQPVDWVPRGSHLAGIIEFRILSTAEPFESTCIDTLMEAFSPPIYLQFTDKNGIYGYVPSFSTSCIQVLPRTFSDRLWIVGAEGCPGALVPVQVWLQYEGSGPGDSIGGFDIPLAWDASVCTVEVITIGPDFGEAPFPWLNLSRIDNQGTMGPPPVPKVTVCAIGSWPPHGSPWVERGTHLAATLDFRILDTATPADSAYVDTLMMAFSPPRYLGFVDKAGIYTYCPSYEGAWISVTPVGLDEFPIETRSLPVYGLLQSYPNPVSTTACIFYQVPDRCSVRLTILDTAGRLIRTLVQREVEPGYHNVEWDGRDWSGENVPSGTYFVRLEGGSQTATRKVCVVR